MRPIVRQLCCIALFFLGKANGAPSSASCKDCHPMEYKLWASSHHALAERPISAQLDRAAFDPPRTFKAGPQTNEIRIKDGQYQIVTLGFNSNVVPYAVDRVIGVEPVRQFLTATTGGHWQTHEVSYDPVANQWFDVFGDDNRHPGEWGHWTGRGMNWNSMCAECHNTRLRKNYDVATDTYHTAMEEMSVGCGSCHTSLSEHTDWQNSHRQSKERDPTISPLSPARMIGACGSCHALRGGITGKFNPGDSFYDHYQLQILDNTDTWFADGQVHGEDYEFTSFLSSKMHERGVTCVDCHNPHSMKTILPGNDLCMRCHSGAFTNAPVINPLGHSHHMALSKGNQCIGCHMPVTVYMQREARHDHGFTTPDPLLTKELNIPNACNRCHADKTSDWAVKYTEQWYGGAMNRPTRERARRIAAAQRAEDGAQAPLIEMLSDARQSPYWRSVAANLLWQWPDDPRVTAALVKLLRDDHPLVREQAVRSLETASLQSAEISAALKPLLGDPSRNVRVAAAWALRTSLDTHSRAGIDLTNMLELNADQPVGEYRLAIFHLDSGDGAKALPCLRKAVAWDPFSPPFRMALANLLGELGKTNEAANEMQILRRQNTNDLNNQP
jgi:hypothetical protein